MKKYEKVTNILYLISGIFFVLVYIPYFMWHLSKGHTADIIASLLVFICVLVPIFTRKYLKKLLKKAYLPMKTLWCVVMCFYMVTFSIFFVVINRESPTEIEKIEGNQEVVIVYGCQVRPDGSLSLELSKRVEQAAKVLQSHPEAICITSGGKGKGEPIPEGDAMKQALISLYGIEEHRIFSENQSTNTKENVEYSVKILENQGYNLEKCSIISVSSNFHTPRIELLCKRNGVKHSFTASSETPRKDLLFIYTVREYMSYVHLFLFGS